MLNVINFLLLVFILICPGVMLRAEEVERERGGVELRGFATLGMARLNTDRYGIISSFSEQRPVRKEWSPYLDSVLGVQLDIIELDSNAFVFQGVWRPGVSDAPKLNLGYWEFRSLNGAKIRIGRISNAMFRETEYFNVGFSQLTARSPLPIYTKLASIAYLDGGDIRLQANNGDWVYGLQFFGGQSKYDHYRFGVNKTPLSAEFKDVNGLVLKAVSGDFTLRFSHTQVGKTEYDSQDARDIAGNLSQIIKGLQYMGQSSQAELLSVYVNPFGSKNLRYSSFSADWQVCDWQFFGEYALLNPNSSVLGIARAWQLTIGKSFGNITPYVSNSRQITKNPPLNEGAFVGPFLKDLRDNIATVVQRGDLSMSTFGIGLRAELKRDVDLKIQIDRVRWNMPYVGSENVRSGEKPNAMLFSVVLDFIF